MKVKIVENTFDKVIFALINFYLLSLIIMCWIILLWAQWNGHGWGFTREGNTTRQSGGPGTDNEMITLPLSTFPQLPTVAGTVAMKSVPPHYTRMENDWLLAVFNSKIAVNVFIALRFVLVEFLNKFLLCLKYCDVAKMESFILISFYACHISQLGKGLFYLPQFTNNPSQLRQQWDLE